MARLDIFNTAYHKEKIVFVEIFEKFVKHCSPGHACEKCVREGYARHWTYEEPVKCGCWCLNQVDLNSLQWVLTLDQIKKLLNKHHE